MHLGRRFSLFFPSFLRIASGLKLACIRYSHRLDLASLQVANRLKNSLYQTLVEAEVDGEFSPLVHR